MSNKPRPKPEVRRGKRRKAKARSFQQPRVGKNFVLTGRVQRWAINWVLQGGSPGRPDQR